MRDGTRVFARFQGRPVSSKGVQEEHSIERPTCEWEIRAKETFAEIDDDAASCLE